MVCSLFEMYTINNIYKLSIESFCGVSCRNLINLIQSDLYSFDKLILKKPDVILEINFVFGKD